MWDIFKDWIFDIIQFFYNFCHDWGLAIIIVTIIFRIIVAPLMHKQAKSNYAMQKVQPKIQALKDRFPDDPTRQSQEMQKIYAEMKFNSALVEEDDYDMLVMGRTQGKGCYCFVNGVLKTQIDKYAGNYKYMVIDNEAGLEHISRGTLPHVDTMLLISDCSRRGVQAVGRIAEMIRELELNPGTMKLIINRAPNGQLNAGVKEEIEKYGLELIGVLPQDETVYEYDCDGKPSSQVPDNTPVKQALHQIMRDLNL